jgi:hypothetical protein
MAEPVQALWIGRPLSAIERLSITSFLRHGHEYHLYRYDDLAHVPPGVVLKDAAEILPRSEIFCYQQGAGRGSVASFSDLFRFKLLLDRGGWWVDTDVVCLRPFDFPDPVIFASEHAREKAKLASAVIRLPAGHPIAARCYEVASLADRATLQWGEIGPDLLTRVVADDGFRYPIMKPAVFCPVPWWDWGALLAEDSRPARALVTGDTYSIHLWQEMWRRAGMTGAAGVSRESALGQLLEHFGVER